MQTRVDLLRQALKDFDVSLEDEALGQEIYFLDEMLRWNTRINLTAIVDPLAMLEKHLIDSLVLLKWCHAGQLLDVGSGAGLPGVPLAIAARQLEVTSLETVGKKCAFQKHIKRSLHLTNLQVVNQRVESYLPQSPPTQIVARAFAKMEQFFAFTRHLIRTGTRLYFMLGAAELDKNLLNSLCIQENIQLLHRDTYVLPFSKARRQFLVFVKQA